MLRSMIVGEVLCGAYAYADRVACDLNDPLNILLGQEQGDDPSDFPSTHFVMNECEMPRTAR